MEAIKAIMVVHVTSSLGGLQISLIQVQYRTLFLSTLTCSKYENKPGYFVGIGEINDNQLTSPTNLKVKKVP